MDARLLQALVAAAVDGVRGTRARVIVNDRVDIALAAGAHGVHLRGDSVPVARVRRICPPGFLVGRSVHTVEEARAAADADYLIFGPVFTTVSKPGAAPAGLTALEAVARSTTVPVLAVGGITVSGCAAVARTGAAGIAAIGMFAAAGDAEVVQQTVSEVRSAFDTRSDAS